MKKTALKLLVGIVIGIILTIFTQNGMETYQHHQKMVWQERYAQIEKQVQAEVDSADRAQQKQQHITDSITAVQQKITDDSIAKIATESRIRKEVAQLLTMVLRTVPAVRQYGDNGCSKYYDGFVIRKVWVDDYHCFEIAEYDNDNSPLLQGNSPYGNVVDNGANGFGEATCYSGVGDATNDGLYLRQAKAGRKNERVAYFKTLQFWKAKLSEKSKKTSI